MKKHHVETLISAQDVQSRIAEVAKEISHHYHHSNCVHFVVIVHLLVYELICRLR